MLRELISRNQEQIRELKNQIREQERNWRKIYWKMGLLSGIIAVLVSKIFGASFTGLFSLSDQTIYFYEDKIEGIGNDREYAVFYQE